MPKKLLIPALVIAGLLVTLMALRRGPGTAPELRKSGVESRAEETAHSRRATAVTAVQVSHEQIMSRRERSEARDRVQQREGRFIAGRVTLLDGTPLEGAVVRADEGTSATTASDGTYRLSNLPQRVWRLSASHSDCITSSVRRIASDQKTQDFALRVKLPVVLVGKVLHHATKQPVRDFAVTGTDREVKMHPGASGSFEVTGLFSGDEISFQIKAEGMAARGVREEIPDDASGTIEREYELGAGGVIRGRIVRTSSSSPVADVGVLAQSFSRRSGRDPGTSATTGSDGRFEITKLPPGHVRLEIRPAEPLIGISRFVGEIGHDEVRDVGDIHIGEGGSIKGKLVRVPGNEPVPGELVQMDRQGGRGWGGNWRGGAEQRERSVTTGADGLFEFTRVGPGRHQLEVGAYNVRESVEMEGEEVREVTLKIGSGVLRGLVLRDATPVEAELDFSRHSRGQRMARAESDDSGTFEVRGLAPGIWKVAIDPDNGQEAELEFEMPEAGVLEKTFVLPSGDIVGRVVNAAGDPVSGARVNLLSQESGEYIPSFGRGGGGWRGRGGGGGGGGEASVETQADGTFRFRDRPAGPASLVARREGMGSSDVTNVQVPDLGDSGEVVLRLGAGTGTLVSTALNLETGEPVREAWVVLTGEKGRFTYGNGRGNDGVMTIPDIPPGRYDAQVSALGHTVSEQSVIIPEGGTVEITDVIMPAGALRWTVVDENGSGVGGIRCRLTPDDAQSIETPREGVTDASGLWSVRGLLPGNYTVTVFREGSSPVSVPVQIGARSLSQESTLLK